MLFVCLFVCERKRKSESESESESEEKRKLVESKGHAARGLLHVQGRKTRGAPEMSRDLITVMPLKITT